MTDTPRCHAAPAATGPLETGATITIEPGEWDRPADPLTWTDLHASQFEELKAELDRLGRILQHMTRGHCSVGILMSDLPRPKPLPLWKQMQQHTRRPRK